MNEEETNEIYKTQIREKQGERNNQSNQKKTNKTNRLNKTMKIKKKDVQIN